MRKGPGLQWSCPRESEWWWGAGVLPGLTARAAPLPRPLRLLVLQRLSFSHMFSWEACPYPLGAEGSLLPLRGWRREWGSPGAGW